ncbi:hypothetical protein ACT7DZ_00170 [Bacillus cereus]
MLWGNLVPVILGTAAFAAFIGSSYTTHTNHESMNIATQGLKKASEQLSTANTALGTLKDAQSSVNNLHKGFLCPTPEGE